MIRHETTVVLCDAHSLTRVVVCAGENIDQWTDTTNKAKDLKISAALWYGDMAQKHLLVLERAKGQVKIFKVDLGAATNVLHLPASATRSYEVAPAAFAAAFPTITTAPKTLVLDSKDIATMTAGKSFVEMYTDKTEGMALVNDCVVALGADNDFGSVGNAESTLVLVQLGTCLSETCTTKGADTSAMRPGASPTSEPDAVAEKASASPATNHKHDNNTGAITGAYIVAMLSFVGTAYVMFKTTQLGTQLKMAHAKEGGPPL
jgi:hypothetical protein